MDSLTQIVLGAAAGEVVCGRKLGNKAMLWGALAGTIPDLDVFARFFMTEIEAMAFHRGISHSIFFSVLAPFVFAYLGRWYYSKSAHEIKAIKGIFIIPVQVIISLAVGALLNFLLFQWIGWYFIPFALATLWIIFLLVFRNTEFTGIEDPNYWEWYLLFLVCFLTHCVLDAFTPYGTQLFLPFSDLRVAWDAISVVDPGFTLPLMVGLLIASFYSRNSTKRVLINKIGIAMACIYLSWGVYNQNKVQQILMQRSAENKEEVISLSVNPTIFNNILWHGVIETDSFIIEGFYSLLDDSAPFEVMRRFEKKHQLLSSCDGNYDFETLKWFSTGLYVLEKRSPTEVIFNNMRFGSIWYEWEDEEPYFIFNYRFGIDCKAKSSQTDRGSTTAQQLGNLWRRIKGI